MSRTRHLVPLCTVLLALSACGGGDKKDAKKDTKAEADADADAKADTKTDAEAKAAPAPKTLEPGKVALPWSFERVSGAVKLGTVVTYALSGKDAKGKEVKDRYQCKVRRHSDAEVGVACNTLDKPSEDKGAGQVAMSGWSQFSPFFVVERPEHELKAREQVTVPAGEFDTVVADVKGFFGARQTVWMIVDKPGIYAKVVQQANAGAEDDKTEKTYELAEIKVEE